MVVGVNALTGGSVQHLTASVKFDILADTEDLEGFAVEIGRALTDGLVVRGMPPRHGVSVRLRRDDTSVQVFDDQEVPA